MPIKFILILIHLCSSMRLGSSALQASYSCHTWLNARTVACLCTLFSYIGLLVTCHVMLNVVLLTCYLHASYILHACLQCLHTLRGTLSLFFLTCGRITTGPGFVLGSPLFLGIYSVVGVRAVNEKDKLSLGFCSKHNRIH